MTLTDADLVQLDAYLEGRMESETEIFHFEERLARDPELAQALDAGLRTDVLARRLARPHAVPARRRVPLLVAAAVTLAAAAAILAVLLRTPAAPTFRSALVASGLDLRANNRELGLDPADALKVPLGTLRGGGDVEVPLEEYLALVEPAQRQRLSDALEGRYHLDDAEYFVVALRTTEACSVVVLLVDDANQVLGPRGEASRIAWPQDVPWTSESGRMEVPGDHVVPRPNVVPGEERLYEPGLLVPIGAGRVTVLVASTAAPLSAALQQDLQTAIDSAAGQPHAADRLARWLEQRGFLTQRWVAAERR